MKPTGEVFPIEVSAFGSERLRALLLRPWVMRLYFLRHLPSLLFWGVRLREVDEDKAVVTIPFSWRTQNPFRSTYFAALCGAAEISTGLLAKIHTEGKGRISMLITHLEAHFVKKATATTTFTCLQGAVLRQAIQRAVDSGQPQTATVTSTGTLPSGEVVVEVQFTWSFFRKS